MRLMMEHTVLKMKTDQTDPDQKEEQSLPVEEHQEKNNGELESVLAPATPSSLAPLPASIMAPSLEIANNVSLYAAADSDDETIKGLQPHTAWTRLVGDPITFLHK
ncbi:hypothetical protein GUJ93_ZPchr0010g9188 [Zizania palustris]|uniref:Uncharacterized protein n=1 Tax=Zizania palustris TaxID=103762 RepID=A0A8J5TIB7_ZIZPA|nr:hypothetical protein GUJ93_ZPchr0010g9188 [Zizania palustris]